jgi:predicted transposase/invertase (TIGR01784 family)
MLTTEWDWDSAREGWKEGWEKGWKEGWKEGLEKGRKKSREEAVKRLLKYGMTPEQIAEALELPPDTVHTYLEAE